MDMRESL